MQVATKLTRTSQLTSQKCSTIFTQKSMNTTHYMRNNRLVIKANNAFIVEHRQRRNQQMFKLTSSPTSTIMSSANCA